MTQKRRIPLRASQSKPPLCILSAAVEMQHHPILVSLMSFFIIDFKFQSQVGRNEDLEAFLTLPPICSKEEGAQGEERG